MQIPRRQEFLVLYFTNDAINVPTQIISLKESRKEMESTSW